MNDFIHPLKQLCKLVCLAPRDCTCISLSPTLFWYPKLTHVEKTNKVRESPAPPPLPSPTFPWEDQTLQLSPPWHILSGRQWAKSTQSNHFPCYFYTSMSATQEGKVISLGVWEQRSGDLRALSESPEASVQHGPGLRRGLEPGRLSPMHSPRRRWHIQG